MQVRTSVKYEMVDVVEQKLLLTAIHGRVAELQTLLEGATKAAQAGSTDDGTVRDDGLAARRYEGSLCARLWDSVLMKGARRTASGVMVVVLYYADIVSDISVLVLLFETGNYAWASIGCSLLVAQFAVVYLRVLPCV